MTRTKTPPLRHVRPSEADELRRQGALLVDVRESDEWKVGHIPGARHLPLSQFAARWQDLPPEGVIVLQCQSGARSQQAAEYLLAQGRRDVLNLAGGIDAWARAGLPVEEGA